MNEVPNRFVRPDPNSHLTSHREARRMDGVTPDEVEAFVDAGSRTVLIRKGGVTLEIPAAQLAFTNSLIESAMQSNGK